MKISVVTLFPEMFEGPFNHSIIKRASEKKLISLKYIHIRDFGIGTHKIVDDKPYGGGAGMVLRADVVGNAIQFARCAPEKKCSEKVVLIDAAGTPFKQEIAHKLTEITHLILVCGHYEGFDERIRSLVDEELSIGDYVLTGGEIPAMVIIDAVVRLLPGVLGNDQSNKHESFQDNLLEGPQYTRPEDFQGAKVPEILRSGNHPEIAKWKKEQAVQKTSLKRPDLIANGVLKNPKHSDSK